MTENSTPWPLTQLNLYLSGYHCIECRCCQGYLKTEKNGNGHKPFLPLEWILQAVDQALPLGLRAVRLCGDDPFQYPQWDELLSHLEKWELDVTVETNGSGLTKQKAARLAQLPHVRVVIEWAGIGQVADGNGTAADAIRGIGLGADSIRKLSEAGLAPQVIFPVTRHTARQIPAVIHIAEQSGAKSIHFAMIPPAMGAAPALVNNDHSSARPRCETLSVEEIIALGYKIERQLSKTTCLHLFINQPPAFRGLHPQAHVEGQGFCNLLNNINILPDGVVALCSAVKSIPQLAFGSIASAANGSGSLEKIWRTHPFLLALRAGMPDLLEGICSRCVMKTACLGYCVAENYLRSGSFYEANWFCQAAEQVGLFPAGRIIENAW